MLQLEIIGNIGGDAVIREINGRNYVSFNVAHTEKKRDSKGGWTSATTWVSVLWYGDGRGLLMYLKRGTKVFVRGTLSAETYKDKGGNVKAALKVLANEVTLCGGVGDRSAAETGGQQQSSTLNPPRYSAPPSSGMFENNDGEGDLPF